MDIIRHVHIISHTHWDREWYLNSKFTNEWLVPFFQALFDLMDKEPEYRFVLDGQTLMIEDWCNELRKKGEDVELFKRKLANYAGEGRLLVGPYYLQPDWQLVSEEALVRNLLIGEQTASEFGPVMRVGWLLDNFGQISQAPQIHREFDIKGVYLWRGVEMDPHAIQSEFLWESPDGSTLMAVYLVGSYRNGMRLAANPESLRERIKVEVDKLAPFATSPNILVMNGYDQEMVPDDVVPFIQEDPHELPYAIKQSTPSEYVDAIERYRPVLHGLKGALYSGRYISVFPGILSSRMYLKTENDLCQRRLGRYAEPLATIAWALGSTYPKQELNRCWKTLLKNHPHDSICGVSIDDVHSDMEVRFQECLAQTDDVVDHTLARWVACVDTSRADKGMPCWVVLNSSPGERSGVVALPRNALPTGVLMDSQNHLLPTQSTKTGSPLAYLSNVPGTGHHVIYSRVASSVEITAASARVDFPVKADPAERTLENEYLHVKIHADGSLTLTDKATHAIYSHIAVFEDCGDAGDTYNYSPPTDDVIITTETHGADIEFLETGPLSVKVRIVHTLALPQELTPDRTRRGQETRRLPIVTWLTLDMHSPFLRFHTRVRNTVKDHRLRILFPTHVDTHVSCAETQFDVVERKIDPPAYDDSSMPQDVKKILLGAREPEPQTIFPQRTFVDLSDGKRGIAILNRGLPEYEVLKSGSTVALTLFRSIGWIARSDLAARVGDAGPLIAVPDAQCLRTMDFHYAVLPHAGDWQAGRVPEIADDFNSELVIAPADRHRGQLPDALSFLSVQDHSHLLKVTAIKLSEDGQAFIVRLHNPTERQLEGRIRSYFKLSRAAYVTLAEKETGGIQIEDDNSFQVVLPAKKIKTVRLETERQSLPPPDGLAAAWTSGEDLDEFDLTEYVPMSAVSERDVQAEEMRADELGEILEQKERIVKEHLAREVHPKDWSILLRSSQLQLDVDTAKRAYWEARLSATLLRKKYMAGQAGLPVTKSTWDQFESRIREIGLALNQTRVNKRAGEYIVDCYQRLMEKDQLPSTADDKDTRE